MPTYRMLFFGSIPLFCFLLRDAMKPAQLQVLEFVLNEIIRAS